MVDAIFRAILLALEIYSFHSARLSLAFSTQFHGTGYATSRIFHCTLVFGRLLDDAMVPTGKAWQFQVVCSADTF